jgi:transcriptional regulator with XRE-family HTH domain
MPALSKEQQDAVREFLSWCVPGVWRIQEEAGAALKMSQEYFSQAKNGKRPIGAAVALRVARAANVTLEDLLGGRAIRLVEKRSPIAIVPYSRGRSITPTPTPAPSSSVRFDHSERSMELPPLPPNRERALGLLVARGHDRDRVDEELALVAFDAGLSPFDDRPVSWWIDGVRSALTRRTNSAPK